MTTAETVTNAIRVTAKSFFIPQKSAPDAGHYLFGYRITISNEGARTTQLLRRHWIIRDGLGQVEEVEGEGVVGEQPRLKQGDSYTYTSACPLHTPFGSMQGTYAMTYDDGFDFQVEIPRFTLAYPGSMN
ncbi:MAG: Co2+/Mg2+ efflux protein ApaG [Candidatus Hydrogenedentes bacterium]|nr:Co2+/Mg2+ efflux protein ApaG [Candidatus Hydrogenedentota bacterium]